MSIGKYKRFKNLFIEDLKIALFSKKFLISIMLVFIVFIFYALPEKILSQNSIYLFNYSYSYTESWLLIIIISSICYSSSFAEDYNSHFYYYIICRDDIDNYLLSKYLSCILSGSISVTVGCIISYGFFSFIGLKNAEYENILITFDFLYKNGNTVLLFFSTIYTIFIAHTFWASIGLISSSIYPNKYIAYSAGYLLAFIINSFSLTFLPQFLSPVLVGKMRSNLGSNLLFIYISIFLLYFILNIFGFLLFKYNAKRRILYG